MIAGDHWQDRNRGETGDGRGTDRTRGRAQVRSEGGGCAGDEASEPCSHVIALLPPPWTARTQCAVFYALHFALYFIDGFPISSILTIQRRLTFTACGRRDTVAWEYEDYCPMRWKGDQVHGVRCKFPGLHPMCETQKLGTG